MTHLRIEQNNILENVSSAVIKKLYELATSGDLDASSHLAGNLYVPATYLEYIDVLTDLTDPKFRDLTITAGITYMMFLDPEVKNKLKGYVGDGTGVIASRFQAMTQLPNGYMDSSNWINLFINDTSLISFNELVQATSCTTLGNSAFEGCTNLLQINISNITSVGTDCFLNCSNCTFNGTLNNLLSISSLAFLNCLLLTGSLTLNLTSLGNSAFERSAISSITINGSITSIPNYAFKSCAQLTTVDLSNSSITSISAYAFDSCTNLTSVTLPNTCTTLLSGAFERCTNLEYINLDYITRFDAEDGMGSNYTFRDCKNLFKNAGIIHLPRLTNMTGNVFGQSSNSYSNPYIKMAIAELLVYYGRANYPFSMCKSMKAMVLPKAKYTDNYSSSYIELTGDAWHENTYFGDISSLQVVELGGISVINDYGLHWNTNLVAFVLHELNIVPTLSGYLSGDAFTKWFPNSNCNIYVPDSFVATMLADSTWSNYSTHIKPISLYNFSDFISETDLVTYYDDVFNNQSS